MTKPLSPQQVEKEPNVEPVSEERIAELVAQINERLEKKAQEDANIGLKREAIHLNSHVFDLGEDNDSEALLMNRFEFEAIQKAFDKEGWIVTSKPDNYQTTSYKFEPK